METSSLTQFEKTPTKKEMSSQNNLLSKPIRMKKWTSKEDQLLEKYQKRFGSKWTRISSLIPSRTPSQCAQRFRRKFKPKKTRKPWSPSEDEHVKELVKTHGKNWQKISCIMKNRSGKQIRDRFSNCLDENIKKESWTAEEDNLLLHYYRIYGPKWAKISKFIKGRPENSVKNRFHSSLKKVVEKKSEEKKQEPLKTIKKTQQFPEIHQQNTLKTPKIDKPPFNEEEKENNPFFKNYDFFSSDENSFTGRPSSKTTKKANPLNSLLPHDILNLKGVKSESSEMSLSMKKSSSSGSEHKNLIRIIKHESFNQ